MLFRRITSIYIGKSFSNLYFQKTCYCTVRHSMRVSVIAVIIVTLVYYGTAGMFLEFVAALPSMLRACYVTSSVGTFQ